jgi:hypothetical protein
LTIVEAPSATGSQPRQVTFRVDGMVKIVA